MAHLRSLCPGCEQPKHESFDENGPEYEVEFPTCRACAMRERRAKSRAANGEDMAGRYGLVYLEDDA